MTNNELDELLNVAKSMPDGCFDDICGDIIWRTSPGSKVCLNTNATWVVGPSMRSKLEAEKAAAFYTFAAKRIVALIEMIRALRGESAEVGSEAMPLIEGGG